MSIAPIRSLRGTLTSIIVATLASALLTMTVALLYRDLTDYRRTLIADLTIDAKIMAGVNETALTFDGVEEARRNLAALSEKSAVMAASLYLPDGSLFAEYTVEGTPRPPRRIASGPSGVRVVGDSIEVVQPVVRDAERLGTLSIRAAYDIKGHVNAYLAILAVMLLISTIVALVFAAVVRRTITRPVEALVAVADDIVTRRDPGRRAPEMPLEEFAVVARAFNSVLDESEQRTQALRRSEKLYRAIGESINYGVWVCDANGRNLYASESFLKLLGITQAQCADLGWTDVLHPDDALATAAAWLECVRTGDVWYREHRYRGADGRFHPMLAQGVAIHDDDGRITGWAGINLDISRLKQTEDALRLADRRKDDFLATLAHELRNPLAPIRHAARLLQMRGTGEAQAQAARDIISRQVARMALLLDDLLEVSRITLGRLELRRERVLLASLVKEAVETSRPLIEQKRHQLEIDLPDTPVELDVDPLRLSQALSNLLTNAAKYTDAGGHIRLAARCSGGEASFEVKDSGIGLAAEALPTVFEMFSQVRSPIDRSEGGLGIGLALVKGLVQLHGGSVSAASEGIGSGSTFTIRLPDCARELPVDHGGSAVAKHEGEAMRASILVVDDNSDAALSLAMVLRTSGYTVSTASSGAEALERADALQPEVLLLDIGMPGLNGYDVARRVRESTWGRKALLVALTGWGQKEDIARAHDAGFDFHITKPADPDRLERMVEEFIRSRD